MCPDRDLISAYVDGEVPSPWSERLEEHLASCPECAALAKSYALLGESLRAETEGADEAALALSVARGRERLDLLLDTASPAGGAVSASPSRPRRRLFAALPSESWRRSISLPLPLAAAAAVLVILLGGATAALALRPMKSSGVQAVASGEIIPQQSLAQPASMDELLRYLDSSQGQVTLTINLPSNTSFGSAGKPVIMREGQVLNGRTVGGSAP
jgi:anti-sigma factor RsiW